MLSIHKMTIQRHEAKHYLQERLWTFYTEFSIWALTAMSVSGLYLWLATRPRFRAAQCSFAAGCGIFVSVR